MGASAGRRGQPRNSERLCRWSKALGFRSPRRAASNRSVFARKKEREGKVGGVRGVPSGINVAVTSTGCARGSSNAHIVATGREQGFGGQSGTTGNLASQARGNVVNPMVVSQVQYPGTRGEE